MKKIKSICLTLVVLAAGLPGAHSETLRTDINPALLYYQAFLVAPSPMSSADQEYLTSKAGREQKLPERFGPICTGYDSEFSLARQAVHCAVPCDWGIDFSRGANAMLPHLARAKALAQAAQLRVMWDLQRGDQTGARDDLLAAFVLARNASRDGTIIGAMVQDAIEAIVFATVAQNFGQFSPETLQQLQGGFDAAPAPGTMAATIMTAEFNLSRWCADQVRQLQQQNPGNEEKVLSGIRGFFEPLADASSRIFLGTPLETNLCQRLLNAAGGTSDGIVKLFGEMDPLYPRLAEIMALPQKDYEGRMKEFDAQIQSSPNPLLPLFLQRLAHVRAREFRIEAQRAMVQAAIQYKLHGESGFNTIKDPFGDGPLAFQRFVFKGRDRGFELKSAYAADSAPFALIFVETPGRAFQISGPKIGEEITK